MRNNFCTNPSGGTYNVNGWSELRERKLVFRLIGVALALSGSVIVIHTVPVFVWYIALIALILLFALVMFSS